MTAIVKFEGANLHDGEVVVDLVFIRQGLSDEAAGSSGVKPWKNFLLRLLASDAQALVDHGVQFVCNTVRKHIPINDRRRGSFQVWSREQVGQSEAWFRS